MCTPLWLQAPPKAHHALHWSTKAGELDSESLDTPANSLSVRHTLAGTRPYRVESAEKICRSRCLYTLGVHAQQ